MEFTNAAWLQTQSIPDLQSVHDERPSATPDDWKEQTASVQGGINDLFGDIQVQTTPSTSANSPGPTYFAIPHLFLTSTAPYGSVQYTGPSQWPSTSAQTVPLSNYSSLNGATSTPSHSQQQSSAPMVIDPALTTMNGSSASPPQQYQQSSFLSSQPQSRMQYQYQPPSHSPALSINPNYVHTNSSHYQHTQQQLSSTLPRHHSHSPPTQQSQGTLSPFVLHSPTSTYYAGIPPASFYGQPSQPQAGSSSAIQPAAQATPPSQSATPQPVPPPAPVNKISAEQRKAELNRDVKPFIQPTSFTGAGAVAQLVNILDDYGIPDVDAGTRLEILTKIRDNAGNHYFRAWVDNSTAMDVIREWLKLAFVGKDNMQLVETIMPILHIIDRLPFTIDKLRDAKLGKLIMRLTKDSPTPAIQDMASNLEKKWRKLLSQEASDKMDNENAEDGKGKKRRAEGTTSKGAPPVKKAAVPGASASTPKAVPVKKEAKQVVKDAKSDSSFFSKPKQTKKEMPSFKKNLPAPAAPVKKELDPNVAQPSSFNPFEEVLKSYASSSNAAAGPSVSTSTPPPASGPSVAGPSSVGGPPVTGRSGLNKVGKPRKSVTWAPDGQLEQVKLIERAIYDDDATTGSHPTHNVRDLDRDEGAALHAHLFDEQIEWAEPQPLEVPPEIQIPPRGGDSQELAVQEEREQHALVVLYTSPAQIPDSPAEPPSQLTDEQAEMGACVMQTGPDVDTWFWSEDSPPQPAEQAQGAPIPAPPPGLVSELVSALASDVVMGDSTQAAAAMSNLYSNVNLDQGSLQHLIQQAQAIVQGSGFAGLGPSAGLPPSQPQHGDPGPGWGPGNQYSEYDRGYHENGGGRGGGDPSRRWNDDNWGPGPGPSGGERGGPYRGRGMGRGGPPRGLGRGRGDGYRSKQRKPCSFFQAGRCRYGDQCDFSHEQLPY